MNNTVAGGYDINASKRAANLTVNGDLLNTAKKMNINISAVLEQALAQTVKSKLEELWLAENDEAIKAYNEKVAQTGLFSDDLRLF